MRKKLIAVLALQIVAVIALLAFSTVGETAFDSKCTEYTVKTDIRWICENADINQTVIYFEAPISDEFYDGAAETGEETEDCLSDFADYRDISEKGKSLSLDEGWLDGEYILYSPEIAEFAYNMYCDPYFDSWEFSDEHDVIATVKVYNHTLKLEALTIDGKSPEDYFRGCMDENQNI